MYKGPIKREEEKTIREWKEVGKLVLLSLPLAVIFYILAVGVLSI